MTKKAANDYAKLRRDVRSDWVQWIRERDEPKYASKKPEALSDLVVLDLSYANMGGLYCSTLLGDWGADVIRVEPPEGDFARTFSPYGEMVNGTGISYLVEGRNKHSTTLRLENTKGKELFKSLVAKADVLIETFKTGVMDDWGLGYETLKEINPRLIYCSMYGYGQFGSDANCGKSSYDNTDQARSGVQQTCGEVLMEGETYDSCPYAIPTRLGGWDAWYEGGINAFLGIMAAVYYRSKTGEGQAIDVTASEAFARNIGFDFSRYASRGTVAQRFGSYDQAVWLYAFLPSTDGGVFLGCVSFRLWEALMDVVSEDDETKDFKDKWGPEAGYDSVLKLLPREVQLAVYKDLEKWTSKRSSEEMIQIAVEYEKNGRLAPVTFACGKIEQLKDVPTRENWFERGLFQEVNDPYYGKILMVNNPFKMTESPPRLKWVCRSVGADNESIYAKYLGLGPSEISRLRNEGVM